MDIDWDKANILYDKGYTYIEIINELNVPMSVFTRNAPKFLKVRSKSEALKLSRSKGRGNLKHSAKTIEKLRQIALASPHRRLKKKTYKYKGVILDSTWELKLAKLLDSLNIKWIRPEPIKWADAKGNIHHYFPDFYLPKYDLFLDPKNPYAQKVQKEKIDIILKRNSNIIIMNLSDINEQFLQNLRLGRLTE